MLRYPILVTTSFFILTFCTRSAESEQTPPTAARAVALQPKGDTTAAQPIVLLELFTSQGCSSCPPADRLLQDISRDETLADRVVGLSYHVDYWNRLGWKDPYSQAAFSERQRWYDQQLNTNVYTPQLIVNGREALVGSRRAEVLSAIRQALEQTPANTIQLELTGEENAALSTKVTYHISGPIEGLVLQLALVDQELSNDVPRGENAGRRLAHSRVVRWLGTEKLDKEEGEVSIDLSVLENPQKGSLIAFTQSRESGEVTGVGRLAVARSKR